MRRDRCVNLVLAASALIGVLGLGPRGSGPGPAPLWPGPAPGAKGTGPEDVPTVAVFRPDPARANGIAVIVCPGGGYAGHAEHEAEPIARWLNSTGALAVVLRYRLGPRYHHPAMLQDAQRAIRLARARAAEWRVSPHRIGILGFSAGGHLASTAATHFDGGDQAATDPIERLSSRPDFAVLIYPVVSMEPPVGHPGSRANLLGTDPPAELVRSLSNETQVTRDTPPVFLVHGADDEAVPVENSLRFAAACREAGVPFELHVFAHGPHGFGLGDSDPSLSRWPELCAAWMRRLPAKAP